MTFRILFGIGAIATAVLGYFFVVGLRDGSVSAFNMRLWAATLAVPLVVLGGAAALKWRGRSRLASLLLLVLALPAITLALVMLVLAVSGVHWQ